MKFRVSKKDLKWFVIFCVGLLYLCAIAVLNLSQMSDDGTLHGLNPIPAFSGDYLPVVLIMFFMFIVLIFSSVSAAIFNKESGFGLKIGDKKESGYSKWATDKEIKNDEDIEKVVPIDENMKYAGIPLINNGKEIYVDNGEYHSLIIGSTGSGKSQTIVKPMVNILAKKGESMIITDPKGELYKSAGEILKARGYNIILLNFREPQKGNAWNPLNLPYEYYKEGNSDKAIELLDDVALNILYDQNNKGEPFWEKSAADYFSGLALGLFLDAKRDEVNLNSINYMSTVGEEKFAGGNFIKEYFNFKGTDSNAYTFASGTINAPNETRGGILSTFRQKIRLFSTRDNLSEMLSYSNFDMRRIGTEKTAVFILIHDEKTTYHSLATIFIKQCYETLIDIAQDNGGKLSIRTNFILDEFANMPPLKDVTTMVTAARSRDIRFNFIIQNIAQLKQVYGAENADTIRGNCSNIIYLISTELAALEEISKLCGEVKSDKDDKTSSTPLVTITDLQKLNKFEAIIMRLRKPPFKTSYTPDFKMKWGHSFGESDFPSRDKKEVKLFDLKEYVKEKKREKLMESINNPDSMNSSKPFDNPFGGGSNPFGGGSNPFGGGSNPFGGGANPFGGGTNPFSDNNPFGGANPFADNNPFASGKDVNNSKTDVSNKSESDKMIENIEKKLKDYIEKNKINKSVDNSKEEVKDNKELENSSETENKKEEVKKIEVEKKTENSNKVSDDKPKVNIDVDSVIVNENVVTDDEYFDDFFGED